ncbi:hypothetical protein BRI6_0963 [plant metagenome]|uniref:Uncharacterized protein n=1 Tax=plant metagenome TaxID=1297885 RepID=A0A484RRT6_9ZZZZ
MFHLEQRPAHHHEGRPSSLFFIGSNTGANSNFPAFSP